MRGRLHRRHGALLREQVRREERRERVLQLRAGLAALLLLVACRSAGKSSDAGAEVVPEKAPADAGSPALTALVQQVLTCEWDPSGIVVRFTADGGTCAAWQAWQDGIKIRRAAPTAAYFDMVDDADPRVRTLALQDLPMRSDWQANPAFAKRLVASAAKETPERNIFDAIIGMIDFARTGLWRDVKALVEAPANTTLQKGVLHVVLIPASNARNDDVWTWVTSKLSDPVLGPEVLTGLQVTREPARRREACTIYSDSLKNDRLAANALLYLSMPGGDCFDALDGAVTATEGWMKSGHVPPGVMLAMDLNWIATNAKAPPATKTHAFAALETLAKTPTMPANEREEAKTFSAKAP